MLDQIIIGSGIILFAIFGLGIGTFFFGKSANREACGSVPHAEPLEDCPSQKAGLCPVEDLSGVVKMAKRAQISYVRQSIEK